MFEIFLAFVAFFIFILGVTFIRLALISPSKDEIDLLLRLDSGPYISHGMIYKDGKIKPTKSVSIGYLKNRT